MVIPQNGSIALISELRYNFASKIQYSEYIKQHWPERGNKYRHPEEFFEELSRVFPRCPWSKQCNILRTV